MELIYLYLLVKDRRSLAGIVGPNPAGDMDVCVVCCQVKYRSLRRADHSSRGVLPSAVCLSVIAERQRLGGLGPLGLSSH